MNVKEKALKGVIATLSEISLKGKLLMKRMAGFFSREYISSTQLLLVQFIKRKKTMFGLTLMNSVRQGYKKGIVQSFGEKFIFIGEKTKHMSLV